jgi:hypothetical protein
MNAMQKHKRKRAARNAMASPERYRMAIGRMYRDWRRRRPNLAESRDFAGASRQQANSPMRKTRKHRENGQDLKLRNAYFQPAHSVTRFSVMVSLSCGFGRVQVWAGQVRGFPVHCHLDSGSAAGMIEENKFFERTWIEFAIGAEFQCDFRFTVRFA